MNTRVFEVPIIRFFDTRVIAQVYFFFINNLCHKAKIIREMAKTI